MARNRSVETLVKEAETIAQIQSRIHAQARPEPASTGPEEFWSPGLGKAQQAIFDSGARFILGHGERYSGKTLGILHKLVKHAWTNHAAHVLIIVGVRRQATAGGAWTKLLRDVLPDWESNLDGFEYDAPRMTQEKDVILEITNRHGTKSIFHLISIPFGGKLADRIKGVECSAVFVDELVGIGGPEYFTAVIQQLGRLVHIPITEQFFAAATNPAGPKHWVYKTFFEDAVLADGTADPKFLVIHVPISENPDPRAKDYYENFVLPAVKNDPIEYQRMVEGKWIDRPSGEAIFGTAFIPEMHIIGSVKEGTILRPTTNIPITLGYDIGDVNHAIVFLQERLTSERTIWLGLDEIVYTDRDIPFATLVPQIMDKMNEWCELEQFSFRFEHISDRSAFDRFRAATGSYDYQQIERMSRELLKKFPERWPWLKVSIRMKECPKPAGSVAARVKLARELFHSQSLYVSVKCEKLADAFLLLESKKDDPLAPARSKHLHPYDACTYALYFNALGGPVAAQSDKEAIKPQVTGVGT